MAYGLEIRKKVLKYIKNGHSSEQASKVFDISARTIYYWLKRDELAPQLSYPKHKKIDKKSLQKFIESHPDAYLREIAEEFNVKISSVHNALKNMGYINKKNTSLQRNKRRPKRKLSKDI